MRDLDLTQRGEIPTPSELDGAIIQNVSSEPALRCGRHIGRTDSDYIGGPRFAIPVCHFIHEIIHAVASHVELDKVHHAFVLVMARTLDECPGRLGLLISIMVSEARTSIAPCILDTWRDCCQDGMGGVYTHNLNRVDRLVDRVVRA